MDKLIDFDYHSDKYVGTNQIVITDKEAVVKKSSNDFTSRKDLKREKRSKRQVDSNVSLLSKKKRKKLQKIVDLKTKKQKRVELEKELLKFRSEKISRAAPSPIEIFSKNRHKKRLERRKEKQCDDNDDAEKDDEEEEEEEEKEEVNDLPSDRSTIEAELRALQTKKRKADELSEDPPKKKRKKKTRKKKAKLVMTKPSSSSSSEEEGDPEAPAIVSREPTEMQAETTETKDAPVAEVRTAKKFVVVNRSEEVMKAREALPILSEEFAIMESLETQDVIVLTGPTGCGKTTQVPQFLYEAGFTENGMKIGVTEPRRVAAISMSHRVATELNLSSREVSYQIRYEGNAGEKTKIKFMTDGVLLQELKTDFYLSSYSALIIDEAHERSVYTDLLIGILSLVVRSRRLNKKKPLKLIIMSATLDAVSFVNNKRLFPNEAPAVVELSGRQHPISLHHLKRTPKDYLLATYTKVCELHRANSLGGGVLVFLTGAQEVQTMVRWLRRSFPGPRPQEEKEKEEEKKEEKEEEKEETGWLVPVKMDNFATIPVDEESDMASSRRPNLPRPAAEQEENSSDSDDFDDDDDFVEMDGEDIPVYRQAPGVHALPLYSLLGSERQNLVFQAPPEGQRLIVVSTNVAETSLTIPNIRFVVDCGRVKEKVYDRVTGVSTFSVNWISKASAKQRAGRAGRTGPGHCHRLYSSQVYEDFEEHALPEILRRPVEDIVLLLKNFIGRISISSFPFPTAPDKEALNAAEDRLTELEALERLPGGKTGITLEGRYMANLPVAPRFAKILLLAYLQEERPALPYAILLVAALSVQELFWPRQRVEANAPATEREKFERTFLKKGQNLLFGDLTLLLGPVWWVCWQLDRNGMTEGRLRERAESFGLRWKAVVEARKLRRHLTEAVNAVFRTVNLPIDAASDSPPTESVLLQLRQMLVIAFSGQIARKAVVPPTASAAEKRGLKKAYFTTLVDGPVYIHPESVVCGEGYEWLLFMELHETTRTNMRRVMAVNPEWLPVILPLHVRVTKPLPEPSPRYCSESDVMLCQAERVEFGIRGWALPSKVWARLPRDQASRECVDAGRWFARLLMEGEVVPEMKRLSEKWMSTCKPALITQPWGTVRSQVKVLLKALGGVTSRKELIEKWREDPKFLWSAVSQWLPPGERAAAESSWPPVKVE